MMIIIKIFLQVKIQKEFKTTLLLIMEIEKDDDFGYHMGVYICLVNMKMHNLKHEDSTPGTDSKFGSFEKIHEYIQTI